MAQTTALPGHVYLESSYASNQYPLNIETGRPLEDLSSRIFWNITKLPDSKNIRILRSDHLGFYEEAETQSLLEKLVLRRDRGSIFYYVLPLVPGYTVYSSVKVVDVAAGKTFSMSNLLQNIYNFYSKKIKQYTPSATPPPANAPTASVEFKAAILSGIQNTSYKNFIDSLVQSISKDETMIFHQLFSFRTMFNGFMTTPNPEDIVMTDQAGRQMVIAKDFLYILSLSNSIALNMESSTDFYSIFDKNYIKNIIREVVSDYKGQKFQKGKFEERKGFQYQRRGKFFGGRYEQREEQNE